MPILNPCCGRSAALYFSRAGIPHSRDLPLSAAWQGALRHIGVYAFRATFLLDHFPLLPRSGLEEAEVLEQLRILDAGFSIGVARVDAAHPGVDTREQLERVRGLYRGEDVWRPQG